MRPRKYILSERVAAPALSARVINLDAGVERRYRPGTAELPMFEAQGQSGTRQRENPDSQLSPATRPTARDLQDVLCSTDVAVILLDTDLTIQFFTPAAKRLFNVIPGEI